MIISVLILRVVYARIRQLLLLSRNGVARFAYMPAVQVNSLRVGGIMGAIAVFSAASAKHQAARSPASTLRWHAEEDAIIASRDSIPLRWAPVAGGTREVAEWAIILCVLLPFGMATPQRLASNDP